MTDRNGSTATKVVVATTVMLSFISFWRASAIVLSDMASTAYYVGGIAESAVGKSAPWFILSIMLFAYAVRALYIESCSMFVRGGVYRVVHEALGGVLAKFSVSALMFDYVLTGPISAISAGLYLAGLINETAEYAGSGNFHVPPGAFAVVFGILVTLYFWRKNTIGIHESSEKALRIMQITTVMVVILIAWCLLTILMNDYQPVPWPTLSNIHFSEEALGWLKGSALQHFTIIAVLIGLGHSLLAMSGEESLAQVNREIAAPKLKNLKRTGFIIFLYSMTFTSLVSFFAVMIIPDSARGAFLDNLIGGLSKFLVGPEPLKLVFHGFVVVVGTLILSGAVNTAIIGSNGVLNRVAEDGVLTDWFRQPHHKFGTTHRLINLVVILQLLTIVLSGGNVYMLGEAYAFGVVWSFFMKSLSVLVLRYKKPEAREWRVPLNFKVGKIEIPLGLALITIALFSLAFMNLLTKRVATISGVIFTLAFFVTFKLSEYLNHRKHGHINAEMEKFRLDLQEEISGQAVKVRPGNILVAVRNPRELEPLHRALESPARPDQDIVVLAVHVVNTAGSGEHELDTSQIFTKREMELFSKVVSVAEKAGRHVDLVVASGTDPFLTIVQAAMNLSSARVIAGASQRMSAPELARRFGQAWEQVLEPRKPLTLQVTGNEKGKELYYVLGPHAPQLWPEDIDLLHQLWLEISKHKGAGAKVHHRDIVGFALRRLQQSLHSQRQEITDRELHELLERRGK